MPNQEVIFNILDLLNTMEEALNYIKEKINELNIEATMPILADVIAAFFSIEESLTPMLDCLEKNAFIHKTEELGKRLDIMLKEYENKKGQKFYEIIQLSLEPAFENWKEEIELRIRPYVAS